MGPIDWLAAIERDGAAVAATRPEFLGRTVPSCPGWTVHDLVVHLGAVHRWAATFLVEGPDSDRRFAPIEDDAPSGAAVTEWYRARLDELLAELRRHDPAEPARNFAGRSTAGFWFRRQAHETAMHRWDGENAGGAAHPIEPTLAADGVAEWAEVFAGRFLRRGPGLANDLVGRTVHLHGTDLPDAEWTFTLGRDSLTVAPTHSKADAALRDTASNLNLALWRRVPLSAIERHGDQAVVDALLDAIRVT